jgi:hypothetical protein
MNPWTVGGVDGNVPSGEDGDSGPRTDNVINPDRDTEED